MEQLKIRSSMLTWLALCILILSLSGGIFTLFLTQGISGDAENINNLGVIRGSIQRVVKLELAGEENQELIDTITRNIEELYTEKKDANKKDAILETITELSTRWVLLVESIETYRGEPTLENEEELLSISEEIWETTNEIVLYSQLISESKVKSYRISYIFTGLNVLLGILIILLIRQYVANHLEYVVEYDTLTNLYNRRYFDIIFKKELLEAKKQKGFFSLIIFDIDHFKKVNDTYGHHVGDKVLKELSRIVEDRTRESDVLARIGGEEFAIIALDTKLKGAYKLSESLRQVVEKHTFKDVEKITISVGVAEYQKEDNYTTLFKRADKALYKAKNSGRNKVEIGNDF